MISGTRAQGGRDDFSNLPDLASRRVGAKAGFSREGLVCTHVAATGRDYDDLLFTLR